MGNNCGKAPIISAVRLLKCAPFFRECCDAQTQKNQWRTAARQARRD